jgi:hypothetical protein
VNWVVIDPRVDLGFLPELIDDADPRPVAEQLQTNYAHGGGWNPQKGFTMDFTTMTLSYPGDPPMKPLAVSKCRGEDLYFYPYSYLAIVQHDGSFEVARVD